MFLMGTYIYTQTVLTCSPLLVYAKCLQQIQY